MINKTIGYTSSDGKFHSTIDDAKVWELSLVVEDMEGGMDAAVRNKITRHIFDNADKIIDILTMKPNSLPKARKINGGTKKRTPKHIADQNTLPLEAK